MIGSVVERQKGFFFVYDEAGRYVCTVHGETLVGFTGSVISIGKNGRVYLYDEKGHNIGIK